jgi:hypothetical protein
MGLFDEDELESLRDMIRAPGASTALGDDEVEQLQDVYWENPDELDKNERESIQSGINAFQDAKGPGINREFEDEIPELFHKSRDPVSRGTDEALSAPEADDWQEFVEKPNRLDFPGVDDL